jgi:hypothetical protein
MLTLGIPHGKFHLFAMQKPLGFWSGRLYGVELSFQNMPKFSVRAGFWLRIRSGDGAVTGRRAKG